jgi:hypothetical protein
VRVLLRVVPSLATSTWYSHMNMRCSIVLGDSQYGQYICFTDITARQVRQAVELTLKECAFASHSWTRS